jgi:branched-chain amino acid transport system substrate-binding protein
MNVLPLGERRTRRRITVTAGLAAAVLLTASACSSSGGSSDGSGGSGDVHLGTVIPLSGAAAATAAQYLAGMTAAINAANANGGVNGHKISLAKVDDGFEVPRTIAGLRKLVQQNHVVGILGPYGTNAATAAVPIASQLKVPIEGPLAYAIALYQPVNQYVFPLFPSQQSIYQALTEYAISDLGLKRIAVMGNDGEVGNETIDGAKKALSAHGLSPVTVIREANAQPDYSGILSQIKSKNADGVVLQSDSASMATILKNAKNVGLTAPFFGGVSSGDASFAKLAGTTGDGTYGVVNIDLTGSADGWSDYSAAIKKYTSTDPTSSFAASGYAAAQVMLGAIAKVKGDVTASSLAAALNNNTFSTLAGPIHFTDSDHLGLKRLLLTVVKGGAVTLPGKTLSAS